jgi:UDP-N-acetylglucosamine/UDP-N-acetylgalactosamine diphosphorylase
MDAAKELIETALEKLRLHHPEHISAPFPAEVIALREEYAKYAQEHVFQFWGDLSPEQQTTLYKQLRSISPSRVNTICKTVFSVSERTHAEAITPPPASLCASALSSSAEDLARWNNAGLEAISQGKVAVLLMAGGQGTRLGSSAPKGCYDIGLPSHKSLFQLQAERLVKLQELAAERFGGRSEEVVIPWYIMTSGSTRKATEQYLGSHKYFGLKVWCRRRGLIVGGECGYF